MLVGNQARFAIEAGEEELVDGWILGRFRFWLCGSPVGNWEDTVDLKGCVRWLGEFAEAPRNRYDPALIHMTPKEIFRLLVDPVFDHGTSGDPDTLPLPHAFSRFHISHLGMSAFEQLNMVLVKDAEGGERCLWRDRKSAEVFQCHLGPGEMEAVAREFCELFARAHR